MHIKFHTFKLWYIKVLQIFVLKVRASLLTSKLSTSCSASSWLSLRQLWEKPNRQSGRWCKTRSKRQYVNNKLFTNALHLFSDRCFCYILHGTCTKTSKYNLKPITNMMQQLDASVPVLREPYSLNELKQQYNMVCLLIRPSSTPITGKRLAFREMHAHLYFISVMFNIMLLYVENLNYMFLIIRLLQNFKS